MTVDESWMANDTFTNVGRPIFFGKVEVPQPRELSWFGMDWDGDGVRDMLNTGEKTSAVWDKTGSITGVPDTIISSRDFKSIHTDQCWDAPENLGWATICPRERDYVGGVHQARALFHLITKCLICKF